MIFKFPKVFFAITFEVTTSLFNSSRYCSYAYTKFDNFSVSTSPISYSLTLANDLFASFIDATCSMANASIWLKIAFTVGADKPVVILNDPKS